VDKVTPPPVLDVALELNAEWPIVVKAVEAIVDLR
jgi:hypothetical protein